MQQEHRYTVTAKQISCLHDTICNFDLTFNAGVDAVALI